jgi:dihydroorotate dehydrogenase
VLGQNTDIAALAELTRGAVKQTGTVDVPAGPNHGQESERIAAIVEYTGPRDDAIATNISWRSAVRVHDRSLLETKDAAVLVATSAKDPVRARTPILVKLKSGKGTI